MYNRSDSLDVPGRNGREKDGKFKRGSHGPMAFHDNEEMKSGEPQDRYSKQSRQNSMQASQESK